MGMARAAAKALGASPRQINRELRRFSHAAQLLSKDRPRLIQKYPKKWVGIFADKIQAADSTFKGLIRKLKQQKIDPSKTLIRFIDTSDRKLIL
jgi:hypothetical protein